MCTDLLVVSEARDQVVNARSQELDERVGYRIMLRRRGMKVMVTMPTATLGGASLADPYLVDLGTSRHDYMGLMMTTEHAPWTPISTAVFDGMNDAGLSVGSLLFPGARYQCVQNGAENVFVGFFVDFLLSNFSTCDQVREAFSSNRVRIVADNGAGFTNDQVEATLGQHFAVHDARGNSLVIECIEGNAVVRDNPVGVLTNLPSLPWHLTNLGLYAHLSNYDTARVDFGKVAYSSPGSPTPTPVEQLPEYRSTGIPGKGNGLAGIPGDFRPASRFVRIAYLKRFAVLPVSSNEAVSQAFHLLNSVDMVKGSSAAKGEPKDDGTDGEVKYDTAQTVVVKDLINKVFYVRMYESPMPYSVSFADFALFVPDDSTAPIDGTQITVPTGPDERLAKPLRVENRYHQQQQEQAHEAVLV